MILFQNDWKLFPNAIIDYDTRNKSALILAEKLRIGGVKNNAFFLALYDTSLKGIDPYSKNLSVVEMTKIGIEIKANPWYYFREIARAPAISGTDPEMVELNRSNVSLWWSFFNHVTYVLTQPRQTGKSFSTDHLMTLLMGFVTNNTQINLLTKDDDLRGKNIKRLKDIYDEMPIYLKLKNKKDINNTEAISINSLGNRYDTYVPQSSPKAAYKLGRGLTSPIFHIDEPPFQPNIEIALPSALAAMGAAIDKAKITNEPYGVILTTTAGKKDDRDGKYIFNYAHEAARWTDKFYDASSPIELREMVTRNSKAGVFRIFGSFTHTQLGKTDDWLKEKLENSNQKGDDANRDFFNIWTSGTQSSPLDVYILEKIANNIKAEKHVTISSIGKYILRWYIDEDKIDEYMANNKTVIGVDTSDASGNDDISFVVVDVKTGSTVAVGNFNETNLITFSQWLVWFLATYINSTMIIERRSSAITIIDYLLMFLPQRQIDPFKRLFNWVSNDPLENKERYQETLVPLNRRSDDIYVRNKKYFGFATSGSGETARSELYSTTLQNAAKRCADRITDRALSEQITSLVIRNGRVDHDVGGHDDLVIGFLLAHWMLTMGRNISHYGIDPNTVLMDSVVKKKLTIEEMVLDSEQGRIRQKITELYKKLSEESDDVLCARYEQELNYLDSRIILKDNEYFSIEATIKQAKEQNKNRARGNYKQDISELHSRYGYGAKSNNNFEHVDVA